MTLTEVTQAECAETSNAYIPADYTVLSATYIGSFDVNMVSGGGSYGGGGGGGGHSSGGGSGVVASGTELNPMVLVTGLEDKRSSTTIWYKAAVTGTFDYSIESTVQFSATVYLASGSKKNEHAAHSAVTKAQGTIVVYGAAAVYIKLVSSNFSVKTTLVSIHSDEAILPYGGVWTADRFSGSTTKDKTPIQTLYYPANKIGYLVTALQEDEYIQHIADVAKGTKQVAEAVELIIDGVLSVSSDGIAAIPLAVIRAQYTWIVQTLVSKAAEFLFRAIYVSEIIEQTGYDLASGPAGGALHGVFFTVTTDEKDNRSYIFETWDEPSASGPKGAVGSFETFSEVGDDFS